MRLFFHQILFSFIFLATSHVQAIESYGDLAAKYTGQGLSKILADLEQFDLDLLPHEAKTPRKNLGELKLYLDVFIFAYPIHDQQDLWKEFRASLDDGYEIVGEFKDIYDALNSYDYPMKEVEKKREKVLKWKNKFLKLIQNEMVVSYLYNPLVGEYQVRKKLPRFSWGAVKIGPKEELSGHENLRRLMSQLILEGAKDLKKLVKVSPKKITKYENEEDFHDLRKLLRFALKFSQFFPNLVNSEVLASDQLLLGKKFVDLCGDMNDQFIRLHRTSKKSKAKKIKREIQESWKEIVHFVTQDKVVSALIQLSQTIYDN